MNIEFQSKKPYTIFSINNFLDNKFYENLRENFPDVNSFKKTDNLKYSLDSYSENYRDLCKSNSAMKNFHEKVLSNEFLSLFYKNFYIYFLKSRLEDPKNLLRLLRFPKLHYTDKNETNYKDFFFQKIKIKIQYSIIKNGGKIVPHTDAIDKLLSLMLYFPNKSNYLEEDKNKLGTIFWKSKINNFRNKHIKSSDNNFFSNSQKLYQTEFKENCLYGFIRNSLSWHSVEEIKMTDDFQRRSININFYI